MRGQTKQNSQVIQLSCILSGYKLDLFVHKCKMDERCGSQDADGPLHMRVLSISKIRTFGRDSHLANL